MWGKFIYGNLHLYKFAIMKYESQLILLGRHCSFSLTAAVVGEQPDSFAGHFDLGKKRWCSSFREFETSIFGTIDKEELPRLTERRYPVISSASKVRNILTDEPLRNRLVEKGHEWANTFSWERNTREILDYLQEIIDEKR